MQRAAGHSGQQTRFVAHHDHVRVPLKYRQDRLDQQLFPQVSLRRRLQVDAEAPHAHLLGGHYGRDVGGVPLANDQGMTAL